LIFFIFRPSKIHVSLTGVVSSLFPLWFRLASDRCRHAVVPFHASFPWNQDELATSTSSFSNASSHCLPSQAKTEVLNPYQHHRPPSSDRLTPTLHLYKKFISTLDNLLTTQPRLCFASCLAKAPRHWSSTCHRCSLSLSSHAYRPSAQRDQTVIN
jgi:hypothetical protein